MFSHRDLALPQTAFLGQQQMFRANADGIATFGLGVSTLDEVHAASR